MVVNDHSSLVLPTTPRTIPTTADVPLATPTARYDPDLADRDTRKRDQEQRTEQLELISSLTRPPRSDVERAARAAKTAELVRWSDADPAQTLFHGYTPPTSLGKAATEAYATVTGKAFSPQVSSVWISHERCLALLPESGTLCRSRQQQHRAPSLSHGSSIHHPPPSFVTIHPRVFIHHSMTDARARPAEGARPGRRRGARRPRASQGRGDHGEW